MLKMSASQSKRIFINSAFMSTWRRFHLEETVKALAVSDQTRFFVCVREPAHENRRPRECYRSNLHEARETADRIVGAHTDVRVGERVGDRPCGIIDADEAAEIARSVGV